jgi:hypothetical protein
MNRTSVASARQVFFSDPPADNVHRVGLEKSFFKSLCLPNGTHKTTSPARLSDVDQITASYLEGSAAVSVLDAAISSGVTTLELLSHLESRGIETSGVGIDICVRAVLQSFPGFDVLYDADGHVLQIATPFFARGRPNQSQKSLPSRALRLAINILESSLIRTWILKSRRPRSLHLVSPRLSRRNRFEIVEHDLCQPRHSWVESFDLARAANILNRDYFSQDQIDVMLKNLTSWLRVGGLLVICSTDGSDGSNHGSIYRKEDTAGRLERIHRFGRGFEFDNRIGTWSKVDRGNEVMRSS